MFRSGIRLWLTALSFVALAVILVVLYQNVRAGHIQAAEGRKEYDQGMFELAEKAYARATEADPNYADAWFRLGKSRKNQGKSATAADALEKATSLRPDRIDWWIEYIEALQWAKRFKDEEQACLIVMERLPPEDPRYIQANMNLAQAIGGQGGENVDRAIRMLEEMLAKNDDSQIRLSLAQVLMMAGRFEESAKQFRQALNSQREE